jgi:protein phosphatase
MFVGPRTPEQRQTFLSLLNAHLELLTHDVLSMVNGTERFVVPLLDADQLVSLCDFVKNIFSIEPSVLDVVSPVVAVGDLHGHFFDLLRILKTCGVPSQGPNIRYLFLGDLVDRGEFSLETITLIFLLKAVYPSQVFLIRGNHEFKAVCATSSFFTEVTIDYPQHPRVFQAFLQSFSYMPIAAVVDSVTVCLHGGIGPMIESIEAIRSVRRPIATYSAPLVAALMWSDPSDQVSEFQVSTRGIGFLFGESALLHFLNRSKAVRLLRGHESVREGFRSLFDDRVVTLFSASNYCGTFQNDASVLVLKPDGDDELKTFRQLPFITRKGVVRRRRVDEAPVPRGAVVSRGAPSERPRPPLPAQATPPPRPRPRAPRDTGMIKTSSSVMTGELTILQHQPPKKIGRQLSQDISWKFQSDFPALVSDG